MAVLTSEEKAQLPPMIEPFARSNKLQEAREMKDGEVEYNDFIHVIHPAEFNSEPEDIVYVTQEEIEIYIEASGRLRDKCFLWVIDQTMIRIVREKTRNIKRTHDPNYVCHTNLTEGQNAHVGGEMFFAEDGRVFVNPFSDRYGGVNISPKEWEATKQYFINVGYKDLVDIIELLGIKLLG